MYLYASLLGVLSISINNKRNLGISSLASLLLVWALSSSSDPMSKYVVHIT